MARFINIIHHLHHPSVLSIPLFHSPSLTAQQVALNYGVDACFIDIIYHEPPSWSTSLLLASKFLFPCPGFPQVSLHCPSWTRMAPNLPRGPAAFKLPLFTLGYLQTSFPCAFWTRLPSNLPSLPFLDQDTSKPISFAFPRPGCL